MSDPIQLRAGHPELKWLRRLSRRRAARMEAGEYLIDGPVLLHEALSAGIDIRRVYAEKDHQAIAEVLAGGDLGPGVLRRVDGGILAKLLDLVNPNGIVSVASMALTPTVDIVESARHGGTLVLVLLDLNDPGNAGTLIRLAEAFGAAGVVFAGDSVDPYAPKTVRAAAGSVFRVAVSSEPDTSDLIDALGVLGSRIWATVLENGSSPEDVDLSGYGAIFIGNEAHGLREEVIEACGARIAIPMMGSVESLNAATAGAVVLAESARQRRMT